eukprot:TRINITY_DN58619_c0_g1_i1.p1 TRINITY_DN58619_c0_g1~~TRINITY_DN58619_c0_g1_i1.p1  ORF type:complete len:320 (+),score=26.24 TRINITY_DN58619_c0_g1_i1:286-1245(+)
MPMIRSLWGSSSTSQIHSQNGERKAAQTRGARIMKRVSSSLLPRRARVQDSPTSSLITGAANSGLHPSLLQSTAPASTSKLAKPKAVSFVPESDVDQVVFAAQLSKRYNIDHFETRRIVKAWDKFRTCPKSERSTDQFGKFIGEIFDVEDVNPSVVETAFQSSLRGNDLCIDDFMAWYLRNMFTDVKALNGRKSRLDRCQIDSCIAAECGIDALTIRSIRQAFDTYDTDKSGEIDFEEFTAMIIKLMKAKAGDVSGGRIRLFWDEARGNETDISFYQFARWYAKNVYSKDTPHFAESLYDSYNPTRMRTKQREAAVPLS